MHWLTGDADADGENDNEDEDDDIAFPNLVTVGATITLFPEDE